MGWLIVISGLIFLPYYMLKELCVLKEFPLTRIFQPNEHWGPYLAEFHVGRYANKANDTGSESFNRADLELQARSSSKNSEIARITGVPIAEEQSTSGGVGKT